MRRRGTGGREADGWIRLYPVNLRHLGERRFRKYDVLDLLAVPQTKSDQRLESYSPRELAVVTTSTAGRSGCATSPP